MSNPEEKLQTMCDKLNAALQLISEAQDIAFELDLREFDLKHDLYNPTEEYIEAVENTYNINQD